MSAAYRVIETWPNAVSSRLEAGPEASAAMSLDASEIEAHRFSVPARCGWKTTQIGAMGTSMVGRGSLARIVAAPEAPLAALVNVLIWALMLLVVLIDH